MITHAAARLVRRLRGPANLAGAPWQGGETSEQDAMLAALAEGQRHFGRFVLQRLLGTSAQGAVWLARDEAEERSAALKFLPDALARDSQIRAELQRLIEKIRPLNNEVLPTRRELHGDGPRVAISGEVVEGSALGALREVRLNGCLDAAELLAWLEPFAAALNAAHETAQGAHGALHPWHLVLTSDGKVKGLDFAIADALARGGERQGVKGGRRASRSWLYASPQVRTGAAPTPLDDVYSLAATIYDLLAGGPPFSAEQLDAKDAPAAPMLIRERRAAQDCWGAKVPVVWEETIAACLALEPSVRPQNIGTLFDRLKLGLAPVEEPVPSVTISAAAAVPADSNEASAQTAPVEQAPVPPAVPVQKDDTSPSDPPAVAATSIAKGAETPEADLTQPAVPAAPAMEAASLPSNPALAHPPSLALEEVAPVPGSAPATIAPPLPPAWTAPVGSITGTLPEANAAEALRLQHAHHRGVLIALACLGVLVLGARLLSERVLPPVLPELPRAPVPAAAELPPPRTGSELVPTPPTAMEDPSAGDHESVAQSLLPQEKPMLPAASPTQVAIAPDGETPATEAAVAPSEAPLPPAPEAAPFSPTATRAAPVPSAKPPKAGQRWINSLGIPFAPLPESPLLVATWETRQRDFQAFLETTGAAPAVSPNASEADHPVVNVSFQEATRFCEWLTKTETAARQLKEGQRYRLPTDLEWSAAASIPFEEGLTLRERDDPNDRTFPWGTAWPPPSDAGNYGGGGDAFEGTAPVGRFPPNRGGLFDMGGNVAEMVSDLIAPELGLHATRGGCFEDTSQRALRQRARGVGEKDRASAPHIGFRIVLDLRTP